MVITKDDIIWKKAVCALCNKEMGYVQLKDPYATKFFNLCRACYREHPNYDAMRRIDV